MEIFRIEHIEDGRGPWRSNCSGVDVFRNACPKTRRIALDPSNLPGPREGETPLSKAFERDEIGCWSKSKREWVFGCHSQDCLFLWFNHKKARAAMGRKGFVIRVYEAARSAVLTGTLQVAFCKDQATLVGEFDL